MKNFIILVSSILAFTSCGGGEATTEVLVKTDTVVVTETTPKDSFLVFGHIEFPSGDGLTITANTYEVIPSNNFILLCHQAGYSRGEYREIAKQLNELGYNCLAIDQRSGKESNAMINETAMRAEKEKKGTTYLDAEQDIIAAINYVYNKTGQEMILWGSSYSAALALKIGMTNDKVKAVVAFSPGEYLKTIDVAKSIEGFTKPVFATGAKSEMKDIEKLMSGVKSEVKVIFTPTEEGIHGSSALWEETPNHAEYWEALKSFLSKLKPTA